MTRTVEYGRPYARFKPTQFMSDAEISISFSFPLIAQFLRNILIYFKALSTSPAL